MTISRAARGLLALAIFLVTTFVDAPAGHAQGSAPRHAHARVADALEHVEGSGARASRSAPTTPAPTPIDDLTLGVTIGSAVRSRTAYETSLTVGARAADLRRHASPRRTRSSPVGRAGSARPSTCRRSAASAGRDSLVYPMRIDLRSGGVPGRRVDTAVIFVVRDARGAAPRLDDDRADRAAPRSTPTGCWSITAFEASVAPTGSLGARWPRSTGWRADTQVSPIDLVDPTVAARPAVPDGRRVRARRRQPAWRQDDGRCRPRRRASSPSSASVVSSALIHVTAMPFSAPTIPSLLASGLSTDLATQQAAGRETGADGPGRRAGLGRRRALPRGRWTTRRSPRWPRSAPRRSSATPTRSNARRSRTSSRPRPPRRSRSAARRSTWCSPTPARRRCSRKPGSSTDAGTGRAGDDRRARHDLAGSSRCRRTRAGSASCCPRGSRRGSGARSSDGWPSAPFLRPVAATDLVAQVPPPAAPSVDRVACDRSASPPRTSRTSSTRAAICWRSDRCSWSRRRSPTGSVSSLLYAESAVYLGNETAGQAWIDHVERR